MTALYHVMPLGAVLLAACAPTSPQPDQPSAPIPRSMVMAKVGATGEKPLLATMQSRLLREPLAGRVTTHGFAKHDLYTVSFAGSCEDNADLVAIVTETVMAAGATDTSCLPESTFAPGEPMTFRKAPAPR